METQTEVVIKHNGKSIVSTINTWRVDITKLKPPFHSLSLSIPFDNQIGCVNSDNELLTAPLSDHFIQALSNHGYNLVAKLGRGSSCVAYLSYEIDKLVTILIRDCEIDEETTSQEHSVVRTVITTLPNYDTYLNTVYNTIYINTPYSNDNVYRELTVNNFGDRPILVLEYLPMNIIDYSLSVSTENRRIIKEYLCTFMLEAHEHFTKYNMEYIDLYHSNIMVGFVENKLYFKYVDIHGMITAISKPEITREDIIGVVRMMIR